MKKITLLFFLLFCLKTYSQQSGGPDQYGYTWLDSNHPNGPTYSWVDIANPQSGIQVFGLGDDNVVGPFSFSTGSFGYYWYDVQKFWVGSNGYVSFNNVNIAHPFPAIPTAGGPNDFIAAMLCDLKFDGVGNLAECWVSKTSDSTIVSFINVPFWTPTSPQYTGSNTFQIVLDPTDKSIYINYLQQQGFSYDSNIKIGIENLSGSIGLQHSANTYPMSGYSIKYAYPDTVTYQVVDASTNWNTNEGSKGLFLTNNDQLSLITNISNSGNQPLSAFQATGEIKDEQNNTLLSDIINIPPLNQGDDTTMSYLQTFMPPGTGTHRFITTLSAPTGDLTPSNNITTQEVVVVDNTQQVVNLNYSDNISDGGLSWNGGNGGIAVYFTPPSYPAKILNTNFLINSNLFLASFSAMIFDDDGQNGMAGTLLDSVYVPSTQIITGMYTQVQTNQNPIINDGGVYVLWYMQGTDIQLAKDLTPPFSKRTFEVLDNIWADYRAHDEEDFLINLNYEPQAPADAGIIEIITPTENTTIDSFVPVVVKIKNFGQATISNFEINYQLAGSPIINEQYTGQPLLPGDSINYTFQELLDPTTGGNQICSWTNLANDVGPGNDMSCLVVNAISTEETNNNKVKIYPNPTIDEFFVTTKQPTTLIIYNREGKKVKEEHIPLFKKIKTNKLLPGLYFYTLTEEKKHGKIVILK